MTATLDAVEQELSAIEAELARRHALTSLLGGIPSKILIPLQQHATYKGLYGGRAGIKSHTFARLLVARVREQKTRWACVREIQNTLRQSVKLLLEDIIRAAGIESEFEFTEREIRCPYNGVITFHGMQDHTAQSIKSLEGYDGAWVEEAQTLSARSLRLLRPTIIRKRGAEMWLGWNPSLPTDPVDELLRGDSPPAGAVVLQTSWQDNPFLPPETFREIEYDRIRDFETYEHVWEGAYETHAEARVFKNWRVEEVAPELLGPAMYGADWGYSVDPATLVRCNTVKGSPRRLHIGAEAYRIGCEIDHLPALFDTVDNAAAREWPVVADSARPDTISYMRRNGYGRMEACEKGKDSVKEGVIFLQGYDITIDPSCRHAIDEFKSYSYVVDRLTDVVTPILQDKKNHIIDPVRYATEKLHKAAKPRAGTW